MDGRQPKPEALGWSATIENFFCQKKKRLGEIVCRTRVF
jgi:hypothetical protein